MTADVRSQGAVLVGGRDLIRAFGPDTEQFLQGQLSQDIAALPIGESAPSLLLHPNGKMVAWLGVTRSADTEFWLDVDAGYGEVVIARLERFKLRTACELELRPEVATTGFGPAAARLADTQAPGLAVRVQESWAGLAAHTVFAATAVDLGAVAAIDSTVADRLRVEAGRPKMGREIDESTIPAATGVVDESASFTKGCYTGQELVARVDSRGNNVPFRLVGLVAPAGSEQIEVAAELFVDGSRVGEVTTAGFSGVLGAEAALGYLGRAIELGATVEVGGSGAEAEVRQLPLVGA